MSHAIHSTTGVIIDDRLYGESGRVLFVLTPQFGIITLLAQGVREQKSKLRTLLSIGTVGNFEFVEGKEVKRLTTIVPGEKFKNLHLSIVKRNVFSRVVQFLERVLVGEGDVSDLYEKVLEGLWLVEDFPVADSRSDERCTLLEMAIIINALYSLGYWQGEEIQGYSQEVLDHIKANKDNLLKQITRAIESTHL